MRQDHLRTAENIPTLDLVRKLLAARFGAISAFVPYPNDKDEVRGFFKVARFEAGGRALVLKWRLPGDPCALEVEDASSRFLHAQGFPVPDVVWFDAPARLIVFEHVPGITCRIEDLAAHAEDAAILLRRVHAVDVATVPAAIPRMPGSDFRSEVEGRFEKLRAKGAAFFGAEWAEIAHAVEALLSRCTYQGTRGLCRIDLNPTNWIEHEDGSLWMIDHEVAAIADIANDLAKMQALLVDTGAVGRFREAYGAAAFDAATDPTVSALLDILKGVRVHTRPAPRKPLYEAKCRTRIARAIAESRRT